MSRNPEMTRGDRARRRQAVIAAINAGETVKTVAARFGMSPCWVRQIAKANGVARKPGRPLGRRWWAECPPHKAADYDFMVRAKRIPAREAREMLEAA